MKQNALPSLRLTCAAWAPTPNFGAASSRASNFTKNSASVSCPSGKLPLVLSCVSMKYFMDKSPSKKGHVMHMHDTTGGKAWFKSSSASVLQICEGGVG